MSFLDEPKDEGEGPWRGPSIVCPGGLLAEGIPAPSPESTTWPIVFAFACAMEYKLSLNRRKGDAAGWRRDTLQALCWRLDDEVGELNDAVDFLTDAHRDERTEKMKKEVLLEAADTANYAMMIADNCNQA